MSEGSADVAARLNANRKALRYVERAHCPKDGRLVAAVVVFEERQYLWCVGGRSGSHAEMMTEWQTNIDDMRRTIAALQERGAPAEAQDRPREALAKFEQIVETWEREGWPAYGMGAAHEMTVDRPDAGLPSLTPCPGCRRDLWIVRDTRGVLTATSTPPHALA